MGPLASVVVPTCGRKPSMQRLLASLASQRGCGPFEVVVVADGVAADATGADAANGYPFTLRVVSQARSGAAASRNHGARLAGGSLLLFLDDDVEIGPETLAAHVRFHADCRGAIGTGELAPRSIVGGFVGAALSGWWESMDTALADPRHRFTFRDLLSGHCSMTRDTFMRVGPFDPALRCQEDFEFGYRAIQQGVNIRYVRDARGWHHDASDLDKIVRRKFDEGVASVQLVRKHPELAPALPLGRALAPGRVPALVQKAATEGRRGSNLLPTGLRAAITVFERLSMRDKWRDALERLMDYWYWRGVAQEAGGAAGVLELRAPAPRISPSMCVDLASGLDEAERRIDAVRPHGLRIFLGSEFIGELSEQSGAEPLRGLHLRPLLLKVFARQLVSASARAGLMPPVLQPAAAPPDPARTPQPCADTTQAA